MFEVLPEESLNPAFIIVNKELGNKMDKVLNH